LKVGRICGRRIPDGTLGSDKTGNGRVWCRYFRRSCFSNNGVWSDPSVSRWDINAWLWHNRKRNNRNRAAGTVFVTVIITIVIVTIVIITIVIITIVIITIVIVTIVIVTIVIVTIVIVI
jgi:hypothetical protein